MIAGIEALLVMKSKVREEVHVEKPFSYEEESQDEFDFILEVGLSGKALTPVYSGDIALALQIPHRCVKDLIEQHYWELRMAYGRCVRVTRQKRGKCLRAMHGYMLPMKAVLQLLTHAEGDSLSRLFHEPRALYACFSDGRFSVSLN